MDNNLGSQKNCLVGNWSEEQALNEYAMAHRKGGGSAHDHGRWGLVRAAQ